MPKALISVFDKTGIVEFAKRLSDAGYDIISTGGTAKAIADAGIFAIDACEYTGFSEMLDGRVKTLHPMIHAGILARRDLPNHMSQLEKASIPPIDMVCVNLYPFKETAADKSSDFERILEYIDIGGPTLIRAAAKNHDSVTVVTDPADYGLIIAQIEDFGEVSLKTRRAMALKAFGHTASYDSAIHTFLCDKFEQRPEVINLSYEKALDLRYGENSHQSAAFYAQNTDECCVSNSRMVGGDKALSFNNILDLNAAIELVKEFENPAAAIIKHLNPSGAGEADEIGKAYSLAKKSDTLSAFGCVVAINRPPTDELALDITSTFVEAVAAPSFSESSLRILSSKKNMRLLETGEMKPTSSSEKDMRKVVGGLLLQDPDIKRIDESATKTVSKRPPSPEETRALLFAWKVCRHTKSNARVLAMPGHTVGIGAGQMSRVDSVKIAAMKAQNSSRGSVMASDAFFPFRDGIDEAAKAGVTAVIQPGGSIRDAEVIKACDEHDMAMIFTGVRCFLH